MLKSSRFEVARAGSSYVFRGRGFGHGLGLCQAGAHVSASRGAAYRQILSRYFPGTTVAEFRNGDSGLRIDESSAVRPSSSSFSDSFANEGEAAGAVFQTAGFVRASYQTTVFDARPSTDSNSFVKLLPARSPQSAAFNQIKSEHFRLSYPRRAARGEAESFLRALESARADVVRRVERASLAAVLPEMEVFVYETTGDFTGATGQPAWVAAVTSGRRMEFQPVEVLRRRGVLTTTPRHELVHAALEALGRGRAPLWLVEGLAAYVAGEGPQLARAGSALRISTDELERRLAHPGSAEETRALYAAAYTEVAALIRREGEPAAWRLAAR